MWESLWEALKWCIAQLAGWFLDLLLWVVEFVYEIANEFLSWLYKLVGEQAIALLKAVKPYVPDDLMSNIVGAYEWLEYINGFLAIKLGITLLVAYYAIYAVIAIYRFIKSFIPFIG